MGLHAWPFRSSTVLIHKPEYLKRTHSSNVIIDRIPSTSHNNEILEALLSSVCCVTARKFYLTEGSMFSKTITFIMSGTLTVTITWPPQGSSFPSKDNHLFAEFLRLVFSLQVQAQAPGNNRGASGHMRGAALFPLQPPGNQN